MRTLSAALAFAAVFAAASAVRAQQNNAPVLPPPPVSPTAPPASTGTGPFRMIDPALKELAHETNTEIGGCVAALDYLRADLAATERRLKARDGGKIPLNQGELVALKVKRVGRQQQACLDLAKKIGGHFDLITRSLAGVEPSNNPGIPPRREKLAALRAKFNAAIKLKGLAADGGDSDQ